MSTTNRVLSFLARQKPGISGRYLYPFAECVGFFGFFDISANGELEASRKEMTKKMFQVDDFRCTVKSKFIFIFD